MLALLQIKSRCCGTLTVQQSKCLALLSMASALGSKNAPRGFHQVLQKLWGSPEESVRGSPGTGRAMRRRGPIAPSGPDRGNCTTSWHGRLRRRAPIAPSGPDCTVGPRSGLDCAVGPRSGPDCTIGPRSGPDSVGPRQLYQAGMA